MACRCLAVPMPRKSDTPVTDLIRELVAAGCPVDAIVLSTGRLERELAAATKASMAGLEVLNKRREWDRERKKRKRAASTGRNISALILETTDSNLSSKKDSRVKSVRQTSTGRGRPVNGIKLPEDWAPSEGHYIEAERAGMSRGDVDDVANRMRHWAAAEGHRALARKADRAGWDACFTGTWLGKAISERKRKGGKQNSWLDAALGN